MDIIAGVITAILVAWKSFSMLFDSKQDFDKSERDSDTSDTSELLDALNGEYPKDRWNGFRYDIWLAISLASGFGVYKFFHWMHYG